MSRKKIVCGIVTLIFIGLLALAIFPVISSSLRQWPEVDDPALLVSDCKKLISTNADTEVVEPEQWSQSIIRLGPISVRVRGNAVYIFISKGGINSAWGYVVTPSETITRHNGLPGFELENSAYSNDWPIFQFVTLE